MKLYTILGVTFNENNRRSLSTFDHGAGTAMETMLVRHGHNVILEHVKDSTYILVHCVAEEEDND